MIGLKLKGLLIPGRVLKSNRVMKALTGLKKRRVCWTIEEI
jgi:hypothetical protein